MRGVIISDRHGNGVAFEAVPADLRDFRFPSDLLERHIRTLVDDNAQWQTLIADNILWEFACSSR